MKTKSRQKNTRSPSYPQMKREAQSATGPPPLLKEIAKYKALRTQQEQPKPQGRGGILKLNKSYNFIEKSPVVDQLATQVRDSGLTYKILAERSGVSPNTVRNLFSGKTLRPAASTVERLGNVFGWKLGWVR